MESKYYVVAQAHAAIHYDTFSKLLCGGRVLLCVLPLVLDDLRSWIQRSLILVKETSSTAVSTMPTSTLPRLEAKTLSQSHHLFLAAQRLLTVVIAAIFGVSKAHRCRRYALISRVQLEWCSQYPCCEARPFPLDYGSFQDGTAYRCWLIPAHNKWRRRLYISLHALPLFSPSSIPTVSSYSSRLRLVIRLEPTLVSFCFWDISRPLVSTNNKHA